MSVIFLSTAYLAPIEYYAAMAKVDTVFLEQCESYEKQSYRNRCYISAANGKIALSIPVEKSRSDKTLTRDIRISEHNNWQVQHWRSIESAYNSTPFFEFYKDDFLPFYENKWNYLLDFNVEIQSKVLELLELNITFQTNDEYKEKVDENILDLRNGIHPKNNSSQTNFTPYYQVFEQKFGFIPNLSIIDLLFNMGNESQLIINSQIAQ